MFAYNFGAKESSPRNFTTWCVTRWGC